VSTGFTGAERNWQARLGKLRDVVRQELVARQLADELPPPSVRAARTDPYRQVAALLHLVARRPG
jgi:hypothetical protein